MGPQGPAGPGNRITLTAVVGSDGVARAPLPAAVGTDPTRPPAVACYVTDNPSSGVWLAVAQSTSTLPFCGLGLTSSGWVALVLQATPGWTAAFAVVY